MEDLCYGWVLHDWMWRGKIKPMLDERERELLQGSFFPSEGDL